MGRLIKYLFVLLALGAVGLAGYALFADLEAPREPVSMPLAQPGGSG